MTALQWIVSEAKKLKKEYPKRFTSWKEYVAQASAIYAKKHKGKSPVGKKHKVGAVKKAAPKKKAAVKKAAPKKKATTKRDYGSHKDTNSHNVKISVVSGALKHDHTTLKFYSDLKKEIAQRESVIHDVTVTRKSELIKRNGKMWFNKWVREAKNHVKAQKKLLTQLKKSI